jgi:hypothetical protein
MGGRGFAKDVDPIDNSRLYVLRNGRWRKLYVPVNPDRVTSGINLAETFAYRYGVDHNVDVGIIPCADGGSSLSQWMPGTLLFDHACYQAELASRTSTIAAVLWHQGESDCDPTNEPLYKERLTTIIEAFREKLGLHDVPFIIGGLGDFLNDFSEHFAFWHKKINVILESMADDEKLIGFTPATGLGGNPDNMHFSAAALREFGLRYYDEFRRLERPDKVFEERNTFDSGIVNALEVL